MGLFANLVGGVNNIIGGLAGAGANLVGAVGNIVTGVANSSSATVFAAGKGGASAAVTQAAVNGSGISAQNGGGGDSIFKDLFNFKNPDGSTNWVKVIGFAVPVLGVGYWLLKKFKIIR